MEDNLFINFLRDLPSSERVSVLSETASSLFVFKLLPPKAQKAVLTYMWNQSTNGLKENEPEKEIIDLLLQLDILTYVQGHLVLQESFRRCVLRGSVQGAHRCVGLVPAQVEKKKKKDKDISKKANERWECVLRFLALPSESNSTNVSPRTRQVFQFAEFSRDGSSSEMEITSNGFQFLLLSPARQIWTYLIELFRLEMSEQKTLGEVLSLLLKIALCVDSESSRAIQVDPSWNARQMDFLMHLREIGLIVMRKRKDGVFYLSPLLSFLSGDSGESRRLMGGIVVETNFRVYAYTSSPLTLAILSTFCDMTYRFHDMSVGILTRESVRNALHVGITADQIVSFLRSNAHPQSANSATPIPVTVADQIRLWEDERRRLQLVDAVLYSGFESEREFVDVLSFTESEDILLFADQPRKTIVVSSDGHERVRAWWRTRGDRQ